MGYLISEGAKKSGGNTKKGVKNARSPNYLNLAAKKTFNYLWHAFIQAFIFQHFDLERHIWIKIIVLDYAIGEVLS